MTTSTEMTRAEIERFLRGSEPKVLCVTGEYGVGKTFLWRSVLERLRKEKGLSFERYSYVSLFGLSSLDDMKSSLFENMEWLDEDPTSLFQQGTTGVKALAARAKKLSELAGALPWVGQFFTRARSLYFSSIRGQIVCIDDVDRRSNDLDLKDVLGLISFLREQRGCKVALLLNAEKLGDKKAEFNALLEKVIEIKTVWPRRRLNPPLSHCLLKMPFPSHSGRTARRLVFEIFGSSTKSSVWCVASMNS